MEAMEELPPDGDTQPLEDAEEGELEEGELDDEDDGGVGEVQVAAPVEVAPPVVATPAETPTAIGIKTEKAEGEPAGGSTNSESDVDDEEKKEKKRKKREKRKHKHKDRKDGKKKKKRSKYVDYDNVKDENGPAGGDKDGSVWGHGGFNQRPVPEAYNSPPGPYDSPDEELSMPRQKGYRKNSYNDREPDAYNNVYGSPPGPYDSPSDGEDEYDAPPAKMKRYDQKGNNKHTMMNMLDDGYMDANVAANEKQDMFDKSVKGPPNKRKLDQRNRYFERQRERQKQQAERQQDGRERERPICKFYKDGKCQKDGEDCQYSHDFDARTKKPDLCKYYLNNYCTKGASCQYYHAWEYPCKFFHTGKECFQGDNCKFSHAELTDETRPLLQRIVSQEQEREEERYEMSPRKKPSLLGSPPRNNMNNPNMKKIPSLFDIKVFPPGQRPPNMDNGPPMGGPGGMGGPNQGGPNGPMGPGGPGMGPPGPGQFGPRGPGMPSPLRAPMGPGLLGMSPMGMGPGPMGNMPHGGNMSPQQGMQNMRPTFYGSERYGEEEKARDQDSRSQEDSEDKENERTSGSPQDGSDGEGKKDQTFDIPAALAPEQRKLFLRIQQQQRDDDAGHQGAGKDQQKSDENWYSSDEEEGSQSQPNSGNQIVDMLKAIRNQPPPNQPNLPPMHMPPPPLLRGPPPPMMMNRPPPPFGPGVGMGGPPPMDIGSMLNMLRNATSATAASTGVRVTRGAQRDPRASGQSDPRSAAAADPRSAAASKTVDPRTAQDTPTSSLDPRVLLPALRPPSEPTVIYSKPGSVDWKLRVVTVDHKPLKELPPCITPMDPRLPSLQQQVIKASKGSSQSKRDAPRSQTKTDPRLQRQSSRSGESPKHPDPRREGSRSPEGDSDPRTVKSPDGQSHTNTGSLPDMLKLPPTLERTLSAPIAAQQLAALIDPKGASRQHSVPAAAKVSRDPRSISRSNSGDDSGKEGGRPSLNYRNDPRFKKKPKSTTSSATSQPTQDTSEPSTKDSSERDGEPDVKPDTLSLRRGNLDHSSPLDGARDSADAGGKPGENSYTSYNRPKGPSRHLSRTSGTEGKSSPPISSASDGMGFVPPPLLVREVSMSPTLLPAGLDEAPPPLKDVFKTLDPTASPFC